jgi:hypothetical protein
MWRHVFPLFLWALPKRGARDRWGQLRNFVCVSPLRGLREQSPYLFARFTNKPKLAA